jgi:hypothetical protein
VVYFTGVNKVHLQELKGSRHALASDLKRRSTSNQLQDLKLITSSSASGACGACGSCGSSLALRVFKKLAESDSKQKMSRFEAA